MSASESTPTSGPALVDHGHAGDVALDEQVRRVLQRGVGVHGHDLGGHDVLDLHVNTSWSLSRSIGRPGPRFIGVGR